MLMQKMRGCGQPFHSRLVEVGLALKFLTSQWHRSLIHAQGTATAQFTTSFMRNLTLHPNGRALYTSTRDGKPRAQVQANTCMQCKS